MSNPFGFAQEEREQAAQDLLDHDVLHGDASDTKTVRARRLGRPLSEWYDRQAGWAMRQDRGAVWLEKVPAHLSPDLGAEWVEQPLDYELYVWALWYSEKVQQNQWVVSEIAREIAAQAAIVVGPDHIDWDNQRHRYSLRRALLHLREIGALEEIDGDLDRWASQREQDVLYRFTSLARRLELNHTMELVDTFGDDLGTDIDAVEGWLQERTPPQQRLYRALLLSPALYRVDDPEAFALLESVEGRTRVQAALHNRLGWDLEVTDTYAAALRPTAPGRRQQYGFPYTNAQLHPVALSLAAVRQGLEEGDPRFVRDEHGRVFFSEAVLESVVRTVAHEHRDQWGSTLGGKPLDKIVDAVREDLTRWGLLRGPDIDGDLHLMPLAGRWSAAYSTPDDDTTADLSQEDDS